MQGPKRTGGGEGARASERGRPKRRSATSYHRQAGPSRGRQRHRLAGLALAGLLATACQTVPITGRKAFNIFPATWDEEIGAQAYQDQVLSQANLVTSGSQLQMVRRVMQRLVAVAQPDVDAPYDWAVNLIQDDKTANAFALPGGKMAVYTGILPITQDEAGLAVVMGHEIGHVVARHGAQRMTQATGIDSLFQLWDAGKLEPLARLAVQYGVELPYSRENESEADHIGLIYLARAGYDPHEAIAFWKRMEAAGGSQPPEFLSTHPSHETRIKDLEGWMPEAEKAYRKATAAP